MNDSDIVSAVVCTRNRAEPLVHVVRSLLRSELANLELIIIDQSDGDESERALKGQITDPRLHYHRSQRRGKGAGLNEALEMARGAIAVCTDDDTEAPPGWIEGMARALESQPSAMIAFCSVVPVPYDRSAGYVPAYELTKNRTLRSISEVCGGLGIGAGMAVRREFVLSIGGFDESFGPGARFPSADDWDIAMRVLLIGHHVYETADLRIIHDGFRSFEEGRAHTKRDWLALGAACAKPLRAGHWNAAVVPAWLFSTRAVWPPLADVLKLRKPRGGVRIRAFLEGFARGLASPVDGKTLRFR